MNFIIIQSSTLQLHEKINLNKNCNQEEAPESSTDEAREREARALASLQERKKEVERALAPSMRDRDKEREFHKRDEAVQHFNALMADLVRNADLSWREAKKQLKKDHRYSLAELLSKEDKERLFTSHIAVLSDKRRAKLRALLDELNVPASAHWRSVRGELKEDPRTPKYSDPDKLEKEFRDYLRDKQITIKADLRQFLMESRNINHKTHAQVTKSHDGLSVVRDSLKHDARYLALDHIPEDRDEIIMSFLEELEKKGPPPPPTATEPSRRKQ